MPYIKYLSRETEFIAADIMALQQVTVNCIYLPAPHHVGLRNILTSVSGRLEDIH